MDSKWFCLSCLLSVWASLMCSGQQVVGGMEAPSTQAAPSTLAFPLVGKPQTYQDVTVNPNAPCNCTDVPSCLAALKPPPACASSPQLSCADLSTCSEHATVSSEWTCGCIVLFTPYMLVAHLITVMSQLSSQAMRPDLQPLLTSVHLH